MKPHPQRTRLVVTSKEKHRLMIGHILHGFILGFRNERFSYGLCSLLSILRKSSLETADTEAAKKFFTGLSKPFPDKAGALWYEEFFNENTSNSILYSCRLLRESDVNQEMMASARKMITDKHPSLLSFFNEHITPKAMDLYEKTNAIMQAIYQQRGGDIKWVPFQNNISKLLANFTDIFNFSKIFREIIDLLFKTPNKYSSDNAMNFYLLLANLRFFTRGNK